MLLSRFRDNNLIKLFLIYKGTLLAIGVTYLTYITYGIMIGGVYISEASGIQDEYNAAITGNLTAGIPFYDNCTARECLFGSSNDQQV